MLASWSGSEPAKERDWDGCEVEQDRPYGVCLCGRSRLEAMEGDLVGPTAVDKRLDTELAGLEELNGHLPPFLLGCIAKSMCLLAKSFVCAIFDSG